jgi:pSer/pThr/pTyr-binding forkhead associated (FHA) protein
MPAFLVYRLGLPMRRVSIDTPPVRVGRDPENDIVVANDTVSREHAAFMQDERRQWHVSCVSGSNPIVVSGKLVTTSAPVADMAEIVVGNDCLIVFVLNPANASHLLDHRRMQQVVCQRCWWTGMASVLRPDSPCPRCGAATVEPAEAAAEVDPSLLNEVAGTRVMSEVEVRSSARVIRNAKLSVLTCTDERGGRRVLSESEPTCLTKTTRELPLRGFWFIGEGFTLAWDGQAWSLTSQMTWPAVRVNGAPVKAARLRTGDVIEVGSNRFELTAE